MLVDYMHYNLKRESIYIDVVASAIADSVMRERGSGREENGFLTCGF